MATRDKYSLNVISVPFITANGSFYLFGEKVIFLRFLRRCFNLPSNGHTAKNCSLFRNDDRNRCEFSCTVSRSEMN